MKITKTALLMTLPLTLLALSVQAHDPKEHMKNGEKPDCAAMTDIDHSKMDVNDPVMAAMMKQCMQASHHDENKAGEKRVSPETGKRDPVSRNAGKSECAALKNSDPSKMDMKDPVIKAMMKKCQN